MRAIRTTKRTCVIWESYKGSHLLVCYSESTSRGSAWAASFRLLAGILTPGSSRPAAERAKGCCRASRLASASSWGTRDCGCCCGPQRRPLPCPWAGLCLLCRLTGPPHLSLRLLSPLSSVVLAVPLPVPSPLSSATPACIPTAVLDLEPCVSLLCSADSSCPLPPLCLKDSACIRSLG